MKINWNIRLRSKKYWLTVIVPVIAIIVGSVIGGIDSNELTNQLTAAVTAVFGLLSYLGGTIDPTTKGITDSDLAMTYKIKTKKQLAAEAQAKENEALKTTINTLRVTVTKLTADKEKMVEKTEAEK